MHIPIPMDVHANMGLRMFSKSLKK